MTEKPDNIFEIEQIATADLAAYAGNARTHSAAQIGQIVASIHEFGFTNPVLIDGGNGIIAGHGRVMAAERIGLETVPCLRLAHLTDSQKRAYVLADNKLALNAGWDEDLLRLELGELRDADFDLELTGFSADELDTLVLDGDSARGDMPDLPDGDKAPFQQMTFNLGDDQAEQVRAALSLAKGMGDFDSANENSNGNALARICEAFLSHAES